MACNLFLNLPGDVKMPALGYGTWQSLDDSLEKALEAALEIGYRHIDTAERYTNEDVIGKVLKKWFDSGKLKREDIFITTKLSPMSMRPENVEENLKESLKKLQLDYVDLYLMHFPIAIIAEGQEIYGDPESNFVDIWKKMEEQQDSGRTRSIGISNFSISNIERLLKNCRIKPANNQVELHAYLQQKELVNYCGKNGITVVAYAPLGSRGYNTLTKNMNLPPKELPDMLSDEVVLATAKKHSKTPAQILLRFLLQLGVAPIPKSVTPSRVKENFEIFDFALDEEDIVKLRKLDKGPSGRVCDFKVFGRLSEHPDFPF